MAEAVNGRGEKGRRGHDGKIISSSFQGSATITQPGEQKKGKKQHVENNIFPASRNALAEQIFRGTAPWGAPVTWKWSCQSASSYISFNTWSPTLTLSTEMYVDSYHSQTD